MKKTNIKLIKLVQMLNDGDYHDGNTIGQSLNLTRSAIWKAIKKLENYGINITSVKGKGYALQQPLLLLDPSIIMQHVQATQPIILEVFETLASTNTYLKTNDHNNAIDICLAEQQTAGKGRLNRNWHSPFGQNVYLSCAYRFQQDISELAGLSLVICLAVIHTLTAYGINEKLAAKWPNDILWDGKKLAGILIEIQAESNGSCRAIIGLGMNVNMTNDNKQQITQPWTSMRSIVNQYIDRNLLCADLINNILTYIQRFESCGFIPFIEEWQRHDCLLGRTIQLTNFNKQITGKAVGLNHQGHLLLELNPEETRAFSSGETSILCH